ncbi:SDR family NAD(P)-dependent oxidoreductase [Pseudomonadota bacterium]
MNKPVVLITGASSGIGKSTAQLFSANGYQVFGTSRSLQESIDSITMLQLDVTSAESVTNCVQQVIDSAGRIDVLVNNAGIVQVAALEETSIEESSLVYETNYFGAIRVTQAVLPHMRAQNGGHIIGVASLASRVSLPTMGTYAATKAALAALYESLRGEVKQFGIKVAIVEPGSHKTSLGSSTLLPQNPLSAYDNMRKAVDTAAQEAADKAPSPDAVAKKIFQIAQKAAPNFRHLVGTDAKMLSLLKLILPERIYEGLLKKALKI